PAARLPSDSLAPMVHRDALQAALERIAALEREVAALREGESSARARKEHELEASRQEREHERQRWAAERRSLREQIAHLARERDALAERLRRDRDRAPIDGGSERQLFKRCLLAAQAGEQARALALLRELSERYPASPKLAGLYARLRCERGHRPSTLGARCPECGSPLSILA